MSSKLLTRNILHMGSYLRGCNTNTVISSANLMLNLCTNLLISTYIPSLKFTLRESKIKGNLPWVGGVNICDNVLLRDNVVFSLRYTWSYLFSLLKLCFYRGNFFRVSNYDPTFFMFFFFHLRFLTVFI